MKDRRLVVILALACLIIGFISGGYVGIKRDIPFMEKKYDEWSIGIYTGESPFTLISPEAIQNPVLTAKDVTDISADFVADPFMVKENSTWYMFFEVMNARTCQGDIGLATSNDGLSWVYQQIVLDEPFHLSYPQVFELNNEYYMIPESYQSYSVRLYKAVNFPTSWSFIGILIYGDYYDSSIFRHNDRWWMFTTDSDDVLRLFYSDALMGSWTEHPESPIIMGNANIARPGGRVLTLDGRIIRFAQDDDPTYGNQVWAFEITELTTVTYDEQEATQNAVLKASGTGWNAVGMHHVDPHEIDENRWIACVDGNREAWVFGFQY